nr:probable E3 ubiquitin-protein ligase makorin-1 [Leptinotarsa decemlineata]
MNKENFQERPICIYNLRGMCRFGSRCWNSHEKPQEIVQERVSIPEEEWNQGACALSPRKSSKSETDCNEENNYGPSTSSVEEAISLVKISESEDKTCGICFDHILKKVKRAEQKFGILPNCNHCFCFPCIKKWRQSKEFEHDVSKACPECRTASDYVFPSNVWMDNKEEKDTFIDKQRKKMKKRDCGYFKKGKGTCPFGNTCLYLHALPNGEVINVGPPKRRRRPSAALLENEAEMLQQILFWINDTDEDSEDDFDDFELDLDDPYIAMQYYDRDDIERYIAMDRIANGSDDEFNMFY